jgi:DNA-binding NarL/FixJ family response regulator
LPFTKRVLRCYFLVVSDIVPHRVFIVDRHLYVQRALAQLLTPHAEFAIQHVASTWAAMPREDFDHRPGLLLLDWESGDIGRAVLGTIRTLANNTKIIGTGVWSSTRDQALAAGVDAFITKTDPPDQVLAVIQRMRRST